MFPIATISDDRIDDRIDEQYEPEGEFRTRQPDWWVEARCNDGNGTLVSLFFSEQIDDINLAKAICERCPVARACLDGALARREAWGVWGGQIIMRGKVIPTKRKRGRPPKCRPALVDPAVAVPHGPLIAAALRERPEVDELPELQTA